MAWRRPGDKPLPEPMMVSLLTQICVTRPQLVNWFQCTNIYAMENWIWLSDMLLTFAAKIMTNANRGKVDICIRIRRHSLRNPNIYPPTPRKKVIIIIPKRSPKPVCRASKLLNTESTMIYNHPSLARSKTYHDDVIKWKHFPRYWPFVRGIHRSPVNSPHKGQWRGALMFTLICARINGWVNNREAGDLRRYRAHYDVIVMLYFFL